MVKLAQDREFIPNVTDDDKNSRVVEDVFKKITEKILSLLEKGWSLGSNRGNPRRLPQIFTKTKNIVE
jgi:hypothetical protein